MEKNVEMLAMHRVLKEGGTTYRAVAMDAQEVAERRAYMRRMLRTFPEWCNADNNTLDEMLIYPVDNGMMVADACGNEYYIPDNRISLKEAEFRKERSMMPFDFMDLTGKDFDWTKYSADVSRAKDMVNKYILKFSQFKDNGMGLYIYSGTKGSGKTMLSCCILNEIAKRYAGSVKFINALDLLEMTKKSYQGSDDELKQLYHAGLLVIDDIGVQLSKEWVDTVFYKLINDRYINRKPTIYTSNIPIDKLKMDDRITDRIESNTYLLTLPEESVRRLVRQQEKAKLLNKIENAPAGAANTDQGKGTAGAAT